MTVVLLEITQRQLTDFEKESILNHAIDLHLLGSDETDNAGFDIIEAKADKVKHLFRITLQGENIGVMYVLPFKDLDHHFEMTILIYEKFRGKHITADAVSQLETRMKSIAKVTLCATVREHNPLRQDLTKLLLRLGYTYSPEHMAFMKKL
jgi:hypothetical protein